MFSFLPRMRLPGFSPDADADDSTQPGLPLPATHKYQERVGHGRGDSASSLDGKPLSLNTLAISAPIPRSSPSSITGFDNDNIPGGSSSASVSSGSAVTAYQYHHLPTSFSSLHHQHQQSNSFTSQGQRLYQNPFFSQSVTLLHGQGLSRIAIETPSPEIGVATSGEEDPEEMDSPVAIPEDPGTVPRYADSQFPAVIRLDSGDYSYVHENPGARGYAADQIGRSASAPPSETYAQQRIQQDPRQYALYGLDSTVNPSSTPIGPGRFNLRLNLNTNAEFTQSLQSLRLVDHIVAASATDVFAGAYDYPRAKQLSPIAEVDYVSPDSLKKTKSLPFMNPSPSSHSATAFSRQNTNNTTNTTNVSPEGSASQPEGSEVTRPSPVYASPFITRPLNRTVSQTSTRTHVSTASSVPTRITSATAKSNDPTPTLPPLDLRPPFPGPHPSQGGPPLRIPKQQRTVGGLSTIMGSDEGGTHPEGSKYTTDDAASLHAESFVTASTRSYGQELPPMMPDDDDDFEEDEKDAASSVHHRQPTFTGESRTSLHSGHSRLRSGSESFISRRWDADAGLGSGGRVLRERKKGCLDTTPAFWAFWLGFVCPFLWLIGGWHFTSFGERQPRSTFWEFYFHADYWKNTLNLCLGRRRKISTSPSEQQSEDARAREIALPAKNGKDKQKEPPPVTRWVAEKQSSEQRRQRLNDPKLSMRGISFGYPFISRPMGREEGKSWTGKSLRRFIKVAGAPNRLFDQLYGVKLMEVRGRPETSRRMFDPWIQRCRYAFCYALILLSIGLCTTSTYLIIYNTRQLRP